MPLPQDVRPVCGEVHGLQGKRFRERRAFPMGHDGVLLEGTQRGALCALQSDLDSGTMK